MAYRNGVLWGGDAEKQLRFSVYQYESMLVELANKIAANDDRPQVEIADIAYADAIYLGELLESDERRAFLSGMELTPTLIDTETSVLFTHKCEKCHKHYRRRSPLVRFCSKECESGPIRRVKKNELEGEPLYRRICEVCGVEFMSSLRVFKCENCKTMKTPRGWYVYGWYDGEELFYVGMGCERRAFTQHKSHGGGYAPCEFRRQQSGKAFKVRIIRDNLTEVGAGLVEAVLINFLQPGCNLAKGHKRNAGDDLTLEGDTDPRVA